MMSTSLRSCAAEPPGPSRPGATQRGRPVPGTFSARTVAELPGGDY
jgi:hypothetical protein